MLNYLWTKCIKIPLGCGGLGEIRTAWIVHCWSWALKPIGESCLKSSLFLYRWIEPPWLTTAFWVKSKACSLDLTLPPHQHFQALLGPTAPVLTPLGPSNTRSSFSAWSLSKCSSASLEHGFLSYLHSWILHMAPDASQTSLWSPGPATQTWSYNSSLNALFPVLSMYCSYLLSCLLQFPFTWLLLHKSWDRLWLVPSPAQA